MSKYVLLIKFTSKGAVGVQQSPDRADAFRTAVQNAGGQVHEMLWTMGPYDAVISFEAPDQETAAALVLGIEGTGSVSTCTLPAFDAAGFRSIVGKIQ